MRRRAAGLGEASEVRGGVTGDAGSGERRGWESDREIVRADVPKFLFAISIP
jgi:hypothetical protein